MRLGVIAILITVSSAFGEDRIFRTNPAFILGTEANRTASVRLGDLDGDGDLDAVLAEGRHWPQQNRILFNDGSGAFPLARNLGDELDTSYATELGDLDNDGDLDIAVGNDRTRKLVFLNHGSGDFARAGVFGALRASTRSLTLHDLNGDGFLDILITNRGQPNRICFNDGQAGFARCEEFGSSKDSTIAVAVADLDGDGDPDLALANRDGQPNFVLVNDGAGGFPERIPFGSGSDETRGVVLADMNDDGRLDIVTANIGEPNGVYLNDGTGGFETGAEFGAAKGVSYCLAVADMDQDGDHDIVIGNAGQTNAVFFNSGAGDSYSEVRFGEEDHVTYGLDLGDVNGDGFPDIAVANSDARNMVYFNLPASMAGRTGGATRMKATPLLYVDEVEPSLAFWAGKIGFETAATVPEGDKIAFAMIVKDGVELMIQSRTSVKNDMPSLLEYTNPQAGVYVEVPDFDQLLELVDGLEVIVPVRETFYGMKEIGVKEPGGNIIVFAAKK